MKLRITGTDREINKLNELLKYQQTVYSRYRDSRIYVDLTKDIELIMKLAEIINDYEQ